MAAPDGQPAAGKKYAASRSVIAAALHLATPAPRRARALAALPVRESAPSRAYFPTPVQLGTYHCIQSYAGAPLHAVRHRRARLPLPVDPVGRRDGRTTLRLARPRRARRRPALHRRRGHAGLELRGERLRPRHVRPRVREPPRSAHARRWGSALGGERGRRTVGAAAARTPGSSCRSICRTARSHRTGHGGPRRPSLRAGGQGTAQAGPTGQGGLGAHRARTCQRPGTSCRGWRSRCPARKARRRTGSPGTSRTAQARRRRRQRHGGAGEANV